MSFWVSHSKAGFQEVLLQPREAGPHEIFHQNPGSSLSRADRKSRGEKEPFRARSGPPRIPFLNITRLILGHRCSIWTSDAGRCFPLNPLSLPQSVYCYFPLGLHLKLLLTARPHTKRHVSSISSLFCKDASIQEVTHLLVTSVCASLAIFKNYHSRSPLGFSLPWWLRW